MSVNPLDALQQKKLDPQRAKRLLVLVNQWKNDKLISLRASQLTVDGPAELEIRYCVEQTKVPFEISVYVGPDVLACYYYSGIIRYIDLQSISVVA